MTGFGKGEAVAQNRKFRVELRSLNSKQLDLSIKLPGKYRAAEADIRAILTQQLQRGKVDCFVSYEATETETYAHINAERFKTYAEELRRVCAESGIAEDAAALMQSVLRMPDVITTEDADVSDEELKAIVEATKAAAEQLDTFRRQQPLPLLPRGCCRGGCSGS